MPPGSPGLQWSVVAAVGSTSTEAGRAGSGRVGGSMKAGFTSKSSESRRLSAFASRNVSAGKFHFVSISFRIEKSPLRNGSDGGDRA